MGEHPNAALMRAAYDAFGRGDLVAVGETMADGFVYHFAGRSPLAGEYRGKDEVFDFWGKQFELTGGTLRVAPGAIAATDEYAFALVEVSAERDERTLRSPGVNVLRFRDGKVAEFWSYAADQYALDEFWS